MVDKKDLREALWNRYTDCPDYRKNPCFCCRSKEITDYDFHIAHVIARSKGGEETLENTRPICAACNQASRTENLLEFKKRRGYESFFCYYEGCISEAICGWFCDEHIHNMYKNYKNMFRDIERAKIKRRKWGSNLTDDLYNYKDIPLYCDPLDFSDKIPILPYEEILPMNNSDTIIEYKHNNKTKYKDKLNILFTVAENVINTEEHNKEQFLLVEEIVKDAIPLWSGFNLSCIIVDLLENKYLTVDELKSQVEKRIDTSDVNINEREKFINMIINYHPVLLIKIVIAWQRSIKNRTYYENIGRDKISSLINALF